MGKFKVGDVVRYVGIVDDVDYSGQPGVILEAPEAVSTLYVRWFDPRMTVRFRSEGYWVCEPNELELLDDTDV